MNKPLALALAAGLSILSTAAPASGVSDAISVDVFYNPNTPEQSTTRRLIDLMQEDPSIRILKWGGIQLPGGAGKAPLMMAIAGKTAPDVGQSWFHVIRNEVGQGFLYPLNEWIGNDLDGDGQIGDDEAIWDGWKKVPPLWRKVATVDGKVYGIPRANTEYLGVIFRIDLVKMAGLDPNQPPQTWDELIYWCQKLSSPANSAQGADDIYDRRGLCLMPYGFMWLPWMQSAGGDPIVQLRKSPKTGKEYLFPLEATSFITSNGEDLSSVKPEWRANFASEAGVRAAGLYHRLRWMKWIRAPTDGEPVTLNDEDVRNGYAMIGDRRVEFKPEDIIKGVARGYSGQRGRSNVFELMARGEIAMMTWYVSDLSEFGNMAGIDPRLLSWFPFPAAPGAGGCRVVQEQRHYIVSYEASGGKTKVQRDKIWKAMTTIGDDASRDYVIRDRVLSGLARFVNPRDLERLGYGEYLRDVPENIRRTFQEIDEGKVRMFTEPWMGFWVTMDSALNTQVISLISAETGEDFDYVSALKEVEMRANSGVMFSTSKETLDKCRPLARIIFVLLVAVIVFFVVLIVRAQLKSNRSKSGVRNVCNPWLAWGLVLPAMLLIGIWSYYPLIRGMVMAFQDYRITGNSPFVGLDNFINLAMDGSFWRSLLRTGYFVFLNMTLAFTAPIILAILLTEVPRFKIFFRTLFFLPNMTSGLVIALLWKLMYEPTPQGFFNQLIRLLNYLPLIKIENQSWLLDPTMAMLCCVLPTVWATMGMASLIYLAALHSIPPDFYEAAEIDGAGIFAKIRYIMIPCILPLIIINFVGAFIGTFQNMGSIFLLTFGGPGEATTVVGLRIWMEAYNNLRFSMATSMAWVLGSLLIGCNGSVISGASSSRRSSTGILPVFPRASRPSSRKD